MPKHLKLYLKLNPKKYSSEKYSLIAAFAVHLLVLFLVFFKMNSATPVLSFSVTMNDLAVNPSNISITSIATTKNPVQKQEKKIVKDERSDQQQKNQQEEKQVAKKSATDNPVDSMQQSAVFAADAPAVFDAAYLQNPTPPYPPLSRRMKEQGLVLLDVYVNAAGKAEKVTIKKSSGFPRLDEAALNTVKNWRFIAARKNQQLVASQVQVPINFILE